MFQQTYILAAKHMFAGSVSLLLHVWISVHRGKGLFKEVQQPLTGKITYLSLDKREAKYVKIRND